MADVTIPVFLILAHLSSFHSVFSITHYISTPGWPSSWELKFPNVKSFVCIFCTSPSCCPLKSALPPGFSVALHSRYCSQETSGHPQLLICFPYLFKRLKCIYIKENYRSMSLVNTDAQVHKHHHTLIGMAIIKIKHGRQQAVSYTHLTLPTTIGWCRSRWSPYH